MQAFIDEILVGALSVKISEIFCTTTDGTKIISGEDWRNSIRDALIASKITFLIITPNYKESEVSLCEMGAAWVSSGVVIPLIVEPINFSTVGIIQQPKQVEKLLDEKSLDRIRDQVQEHLEISPKEIKSDRWTLKKYEFMEKVNKIVEASPFLPPLSREDFDKALNDKLDIQNAMKVLISEKNQQDKMIEKLKMAKDPAEIKAIEKEFKNTDLIDEFGDLSKVVKDKLKSLHPIIRGIAFITYSGKNVSISYKGYEDAIDDAISRDYIGEDLTADWGSTRLMSELYSALSDLSIFVNEISENDPFIDDYYDQYKAPLSTSNLDFWEEVFDSKVYLS